ncbi:SHOCT domain-containing protein [Cellulomonas edaphi]|uniref:SHOCT domain-containing protein n=1 Tax=Cellulomonas edaphi TaxID=3053468 RepID=A0ABT7S4A8_9CELL|nr:SHOCT domain-containing protein [Cellulomons edaphi]MDM7830459.1 SHOCT domain-containing protein [Cellulomons edaphi]
MPPLRRRGRPGLIGTMARTAVISGTATATANAVTRRQAARDQAADERTSHEQATFEQQQLDAAEQQRQREAAARQAAAQGDQTAAPPAPDDVTARLLQLAELYSAGVLDEAEFTAAKERLLA